MLSVSNAAFHKLLRATRRLALPLLCGAGCAAPQADVDAEARLSAALELSGAVAFRQEGDPLDAPQGAGDTLALEDAVRRAVLTSPELQAALARVRAAQAEADLARLLPNPVLSLVFRFPEGGGQTAVEAGLGADLLALLQRPRRSSAAGNRLEAEAAAALSTALDVLAEVQALYADAQALEELMPLLADRLRVLDRLRAVAQARLDLGEGTRSDVTSLDAERLELAVETAQRAQELRLARLGLARRIGEPSGAAEWRLDAWQGPEDLPLDEPAWIDAALRARPEILALEWELRARGDDVALARGSVWEGAALGIDAERDGGWSLGPSVSAPLPIFDPGAAQQMRAAAFESEARHRLTEVRRGIVLEVRTALAALASSQASLARVTAELIPLQALRRTDVEEAYRLGHVDVTALLFAERALQEAETRRVGLERDVTAARVHLERGVGGSAIVQTALAVNRGVRP